MFEQTIETSANPRITVTESKGNLTVRAADEQRVTIRVDGEAEDLDLEQEGEALTLSVRRGCEIACPPGSTLAVQTGQGNVRIEDVQGAIAVDTVNGSLTLREVGPAKVEKVDGNLRAQEVDGDLQVGSVHGNARAYDVEGVLSLDDVWGNLRARHIDGDLEGGTVKGNARVRHVAGHCSLKEVLGNLTVEELAGGLAAERVAGNARLRTDFAPGAVYRLSANGGLRIYVPADASLSLTLQARGGVHSRISGLILEEEGEELKGALGAGEATLEARVNGTIILKSPGSEEVSPEDFEVDMAFLDELGQIGPMIEARVAEAMAGVEVQLETSLGRLDSERLRRRVERAAGRSVRAAQQAAEEVRRAAEQEAQRARVRADRARRRWQRASGERPRPRRESVSEEEQLRILRMVEEGKITPEQAADLLAALGGK